MDEMKFSEHPELQEAWHDGLGLQNNWFCSLKTLKLDNCDIEPYAIPSTILPCLKSLNELEVRKCNNVKVIFAGNDTQKISSQLNNLTLEDLSDLEHVWEKNYQASLVFPNLQQVSVRGCKSMQTLFPAVVAKNLKILEKLEIKSCDELREIVGKEEDAATGLPIKFVFPHLTSLYLYKLPELTYFYPEIFTVECPKLDDFSVLDCPKLELFQGAHHKADAENICTSINRQPLMSDLNAIFLEKLSLDWKHISVLMLGGHVEDLKSLNRIDLYFDVDENEKPTLPLEILEKAPNLQVLWLGLINSLEIFLTQHPKISEHRILGQLKILTLHMVSQLQYINLEDSWLNTVCEKLHELNVTNCPDLTKLFRSPSAVSFAYLKELNISGCHGLKYLFTSSVAKVLMLLEKITVKESESLVEIVAKEHDGKSSQGIRFELLYRIYLNSLSSLECFYSGTEPLLLPSLTQVDIWWCPKMDAFSRGEIDAKSFSGIQVSSDSNDELIFDSDLNPSVKRVFLLQMLSEGMDRMKFSKHPELLEAWRDGHSLHINWFFSLKTLKLDNCDFEQYAIPSNILPCLNNLKELAVRNCNKVKVIFDMNDTEIRETTSRLKYLTLEGLSELTLVWTENSQGILRFQNLQQVSVSGCKSMQTLFPAVLAKNLKMLEKLEINSCDELREIVGKKEDEATDLTIKFMFPCLTSLYLYKLPELTSFYPETFIVECPSLNNLFVLECLKLELFQRAYLEGEGESMSTSITRQPLFSDLKAICILEELSLNWRHIPVLSLGQHTEDLKYLNKILLCFYGDENGKPTLPVEILEKAPNLQAMTIECFHSLDIFLGQSTNIGERELFGHLKILKLANVSKLKFIWSKDSSWLNPICEKLHKLNVHNCHDLITLIHSPSAVSFSNLKELDITECDGLNYLFTCSTAIRLMHLENITIQNCSSMKQIVAKDQDEAPQGSKFMRLEWIVIHSLSSLECFYSGNDTLQLPSLTQVDICQCPNMKAFSEGPTHAKSFRGIKVSSYSNDDLVLYNNDLNASVEKVFLLQKDHLVFKHFILSLKAIWLYTETCPNWGFCNLKSLVMEGCEFLPDVILPSHLLPLLSNLKTLEVRKCNSVKAIFVHTKNGSQGSLSLPNLEKLCVENCVKLLEIVAKDETTKEANEEIIMFPRVALLRLLNLYNLRCIYPGMRILEWPMLTELYVMHCPVLNIFATEIESSRDSHPKCQDSFPTNQQALISLEKVTPSLKVLTLCKEEGKMIEQGKLHVDLQELDTLILQCFHDRTDVFPFVFRSKAPLPSTKHLVVRHSDFKEIFPSQTPDVDYTKILSQLRTLELRSLSQLKSIGLEHSWMGPFLENLQTMHVLHCSCLTSLTPSTVPFSKLRKLNVQNCNGLKYLFTSSTAKTLSVLKEMNLINCESIVEIVAKEDESNEGDMIFEQLNILTLSSLPKLGSFYMGSFTLNFSSLKEVSFKQCYNTKVFRLGDRVPDELKVTIDGVRWKGDKNEVIMQQIQEESA